MKLALIGSSRFKDLFDAANRELTLKGHIVYSIAMISTGDTLSEPQKTILDLVHLRKILESDAVVLVSDATGYYGTSTNREFQWAQIVGRQIFSDPAEVPPVFRRIRIRGDDFNG